MSVARRAFAPICILLLATCAEPTDVEQTDEPEFDGLETVACQGLSLAATSGVPMDRIAAGVVPGTLDPPLAARVLEAGGSSVGYAWFEINEEDELEFVTPLHPSGELEGGDVVVRVTDGAVACAPIAFTVEALPASPGELEAVVDGLQEVLRLQAAILETTPEELMATPLENIGEALLPMAIVQFVLDHPDNDESLRRIVEGTAPGSVALDLPDALLARTGFRTELEGRLPAPSRAPSAPLATVGVDDCTPDAVGSDTQRLSDCMNAEADLDAFLESFADEAGVGLAAAIALMATLPEADGALQAALGTIAWVAVQQQLRTSATLPCCLTGDIPDVVPARFDEDDESTGTWSVQLGAHSRGWDAAVSNLDVLLALGTLDALRKVGVDNIDVIRGVRDLLEGEVSEWVPDLEIPRQDFGPVPVDDEEWSDVAYEPTLGPPSVEKVTHTTYRPIGVGRTRVEVSTPPEGGERKFGRTQQLTMSADIDVDSIIIRIEPQDTVLEPGDNATFRVTIENSRFPQKWSAGVDQGSLQLPASTGEKTFDLPYEAPSSPDFDRPAVLDVLHTAETGARANGPERRKEANIRFGKVEISPDDPLCQPLSGGRTFTAEVSGPADKSVTWTADEGTIDQSGLYTAPSVRPASGMATVRATSNAYPEIFDEVTFPVGCTCTFRLSVEGQTIVAEPGDRLSFLARREDPTNEQEPRRLVSVSVVRASESWEAFLLPPDTEVSSRPDAPGSWLMRVQGDMTLAEPDVIWSGDADLNLTKFAPPSLSGAAVEGSIDGASVDIASTGDPRTVFFDWYFSIELGPGEFQCIVPEPGGE